MAVETKRPIQHVTKTVRRVLDHPVGHWRAEDLTYQNEGLRLGDLLFPYGMYSLFAGRRTVAEDTNEAYRPPARLF